MSMSDKSFKVFLTSSFLQSLEQGLPSSTPNRKQKCWLSTGPDFCSVYRSQKSDLEYATLPQTVLATLVLIFGMNIVMCSET